MSTQLKLTPGVPLAAEGNRMQALSLGLSLLCIPGCLIVELWGDAIFPPNRNCRLCGLLAQLSQVTWSRYTRSDWSPRKLSSLYKTAPVVSEGSRQPQFLSLPLSFSLFHSLTHCCHLSERGWCCHWWLPDLCCNENSALGNTEWMAGPQPGSGSSRLDQAIWVQFNRGAIETALVF